RERLRPDHLAAALPRAEAVPVQDHAAAHAEAGAGERDQVLDVAVRADRRHRCLQVVDADAVAGEDVVVLVELGLQLPEVGVPGGARVVVLPLLRVLGPDLVLSRPRDEHLAQRPESLCAPRPAPDLLDLVVEVGLVEHVVAERLAALEPRQRLEHLELVVLLGDPRRRVRQLDRVAVGGANDEGHRLARPGSSLLQHRQPPISRSVSSICPRYAGNENSRIGKLSGKCPRYRGYQIPGGDGFTATVCTPAARSSSTRRRTSSGDPETVIASAASSEIAASAPSASPAATSSRTSSTRSPKPAAAKLSA